MARIGFILKDDLKAQFSAYCRANSMTVTEVLIKFIKSKISVVSTKTKEVFNPEEPLEEQFEQGDTPEEYKKPSWAEDDDWDD